jgi:hypothetical protein
MKNNANSFRILGAVIGIALMAGGITTSSQAENWAWQNTSLGGK